MSIETDLAYYRARLTEIRAALTKARRAISTREGDVQIQRDYQNLLQEEKMVLGQVKQLEAAQASPRGARSRSIVPW